MSERRDRINAAVEADDLRALRNEYQDWLTEEMDKRALLKAEADRLRARVHELESAAQALLDAFEETGQTRKVAVEAFVSSLVTDFTTAVLSDPEMTEEQRADWLGTEWATGRSGAPS